jgi:hypothetical protein
MTTISYDPDGMWHVGHHIFPEMHDRHLEARTLLRGDDVENPSTIFAGDLYELTGTRWSETVADFSSRLATTAGRLTYLGEAVEVAVLNHIRTDQLSVEAFDRAEYRTEVMEELQ